jgi:rhamnosyltransferase subunit B
MAHIALLPLGSAGDVFPFIWLGRGLKSRGHHVTLITASLFEKSVSQAGLNFIGFGRPEEFEELQRDPRLWKAYRGTRLVFDHMGKLVAVHREELHKLHRQHAIDLMLGPLTAFGARVIREELGIPYHIVHLQPAVVVSMHDTPVFFNGTAWIRKLPRWLKHLIINKSPNPVDHVCLPYVREVCAAAGIKPPRSLWLDWWHSPDGVLMLYPDWFAAPQPDWPETYHQHTFPLEDLASEQTMPDSLQRFLSGGDKPVVFTPGSANIQARDFFAAALGAVQKINARAVFVTRDLSQLPTSLPGGVHAIGFVSFSQILPHASAFVHHGGIGTLSQGFAAAVPQLIMPMAHDQPDNAYRLERIGAGLSLTPRRFTAERLASMLSQLLNKPAYASAARRCADRIQSDASAESMLDWLEKRISTPVPRRT